MADKFEFTEQDQKRINSFAKSLADVSSMLIEKVEEVKNNLSGADAEKFAEIWEQESGEAKMQELKTVMSELNGKLKKI